MRLIGVTVTVLSLVVSHCLLFVYQHNAHVRLIELRLTMPYCLPMHSAYSANRVTSYHALLFTNAMHLLGYISYVLPCLIAYHCSVPTLLTDLRLTMPYCFPMQCAYSANCVTSYHVLVRVTTFALSYFILKGAYTRVTELGCLSMCLLE